MEDCYRVLGVKSSASAAEIKRAFRARAKELHPDTAGEGVDNAERMRALILAYETLSNPGRRAEFDATWASFRKYREGSSSDSSFDYRMWLMQRSDPESRSKLIFFDLLHDLEEEAVREYLLQLEKDPSFPLSRFFDREDFMDCAFILAEELDLRSYPLEAFHLLIEVYRMESRKPYFKHFFPEVVLMVRTLVRTKLAGFVPDELALDALETALELKFGKKDDAFILKLMAQCYERMGDSHTAALCVREALRQDPKITGMRELKKRLEVYE